MLPDCAGEAPNRGSQVANLLQKGLHVALVAGSGKPHTEHVLPLEAFQVGEKLALLVKLKVELPGLDEEAPVVAFEAGFLLAGPLDLLGYFIFQLIWRMPPLTILHWYN